MMKLFFPSGRFRMRFFLLLLLFFSVCRAVLCWFSQLNCSSRSVHRLYMNICFLGFPSYYYVRCLLFELVLCCCCCCWFFFHFFGSLTLLTQFQVVLVLLFKLSFFLIKHFFVFLLGQNVPAAVSCGYSLLSFFSLFLAPLLLRSTLCFILIICN